MYYNSVVANYYLIRKNIVIVARKRHQPIEISYTFRYLKKNHIKFDYTRLFDRKTRETMFCDTVHGLAIQRRSSIRFVQHRNRFIRHNINVFVSNVSEDDT